MWRILRPDAVAVLNDKMARKSLARYFAVMQYEKVAKFMIAKRIPADFGENDTLEELWKRHEEATRVFNEVERDVDAKLSSFKDLPDVEKSYMDLKIKIAERILGSCHLCTRRCGVNRLKGGLGFCRCGAEIKVSSIFEHVGEEPELVPSGTVFTMGCTMRCKHCQNWTISQWVEDGEPYTPDELAEEVKRLREAGCRNANLVGGEPTPWLKQWLETFKSLNVSVPVVWNSNSYYSQETANLLAGFVDVYLLDFKYGPRDCAERISEAMNYWEVCTYNHLKAKEHGELIIRVLVLPNHLECCVKPIVDWIAENLGIETRVNIMFQYRPEWKAYEIPELRRRLTRNEMEKAIQLAKGAGLINFIT